MTNITSEVIKDLLPLYVDGVVSEDTKKLVEEFLKTNDECKTYYESLTDDSVLAVEKKNADDKAVIKSLFKRMKRKKKIGILVSSLLAAMTVCGLFYGVTACESYIGYEDSGIYVKDSILKTDRNYHCAYWYEPQADPEGNLTEFIYLKGTVYTEHFESSKMIEICDLSVPEQSVEEDDNGKITESVQFVKEIYYVPEEYVKKLEEQKKQTAEDGYLENHLDELKEASALVWKSQM